MTTDRKRGYLYILLAAMLYSTTEVALKALGGAFAPMQVTVERVLLGAAALMPLCTERPQKAGYPALQRQTGAISHCSVF